MDAGLEGETGREARWGRGHGMSYMSQWAEIAPPGRMLLHGQAMFNPAVRSRKTNAATQDPQCLPSAMARTHPRIVREKRKRPMMRYCYGGTRVRPELHWEPQELTAGEWFHPVQSDRAKSGARDRTTTLTL